MAKRVQAVKEESGTRRSEERAAPPPGSDPVVANAVAKGKKLKEDMDRLVDEIDGVLDENMKHEALKVFVQKGGE